MRRQTCGFVCVLVLTSIGLLAPGVSAVASNGPAQDGACPPPYRLESVSGIPLRIALDAATGSIDNLICVLDLNEHAPFPRNLIDNLVQA